MSTTNSGGPAFPLQSIGPEFSPGYAGMTLRDYFAAKAMQAAIARDAHGNRNMGQHADFAYVMAEAMLKARSA